MTELTFEYWNKLAEQVILISALLSGFSITVIASLLVYESKNRISTSIFKLACLAAASFLVSIFAFTKILMISTPGHPLKVDASDFTFPSLFGFIALVVGILSLLGLIALAGWTKSKKTGIFTTILGVLACILIFIFLS